MKNFFLLLTLLFLLASLNGCMPKTKSEATIINTLTKLTITMASEKNPFLNKELNTTTQGIFIVSNAGDATALSINIPLLDTDEAFYYDENARGTCFNKTNLAAGETCTLIVTFKPTANGMHPANIIVNYHHAAGKAQAIYSLIGNAGKPGALSIVSHTPYMGVTPPTKTLEKIVTLSNDGVLDLKNIRISFSPSATGSEISYINFKGGIFPGTGGTCSTILKGGESCTIVVTFSPPESATLEIMHKYTALVKYLDPNNAAQYAFTLQAICDEVAGRLRAEDGSFSLSFDDVLKGQKNTKIMTFMNNGFLPLTITSLDIQSPFSASITSESCQIGTQLDVNETCSMGFEFFPTSTEIAGPYTSTTTFTIESGLGPRYLNIAFTATAVEPAKLEFLKDSITLSSYDYGLVGTGETVTATITLKNTGGYDATKVIYTSPSAPFNLFSKGSCSTTRTVGSNCVIKLQFKPSELGVTSNDKVFKITYFNGVETTSATLDLRGTGVALGFLSANFTPEFLDNGTYREWSNIPSSYFGPVTPNFSPLDPAITLYRDFEKTEAFQNTQIVVKLENKGLGPLYDLTLPQLAVTATQFYNHYGTPIAAYSFADSAFLGQDVYRLPSASSDCYDLPSPVTMSSGDFCYITLLFSPTMTQNLTLDINFPYTRDDVSPSLSAKTLVYRFIAAGTQKSIINYNGTATILDFKSVSLYQTNARILNIVNTGNSSATYDFGTINDTTDFSFGYGGSFPGINPSSLSYRPCNGGSLNIGYACDIGIYGTPTQTGTRTAIFELSYSDPLGTDLFTFPLQVFGGNFAFIRNLSSSYFSNDPGSPATLPPTTASGTSSLIQLPIKNAGTLAACSISCSFPSFVTIDSNCPASLAPAETATISFYFTPTEVKYYTGSLKISYDSDCSGDLDTTTTNYLSASGINPAMIVLKKNGLKITDFSYGLATIDTTTATSFIVTNTGASVASDVTYSFSSGVSSRFSVLQAGTSCSTTGTGTIASNISCNLSVGFTPTEDDVALTVNDVLNISYFNGASSKTATLAISGKVQPPAATFTKWTELYAVGRIMKYVSGSDPVVGMDDAQIRLSWKHMTMPSGYMINRYGIWKKSSLDSAYPENPYGTVDVADCSLANCSFTDSPVSEGTIIYYQVRPHVVKTSSGKELGYAPVNEAWSQVRMITPPIGMALVHRWMANLDFCSRWKPSSTIEWVPDSSTASIVTYHPVCDYLASGSTYGHYDFGRDLFVDRLEVSGSSSTPYIYMGLAPLKLAQTTAQYTCTKFSSVSIDGVSYSKRLLSHKEFLAAGSWSASLTDATIEQTETASSTTLKCNGSGSAAELTGNNTECVSRYGIFDMIGNVYEWQSDRIISKTGVTDPSQRIVSTNTDMDDILVSGVASSMIDQGPCFVPALGLLIAKVGPTCAPDEIDPTTIPTKFHSDYYLAPSSSSLMGMFSGGSYNASATGVPISGLYMTGWTLPTTLIGFRCGFSVNY